MAKVPGVVVNLTGQDGNVFNVIGIVSKEIKRAGFPALAKEYTDACFTADSYNEVLRITQDYVEVT